MSHFTVIKTQLRDQIALVKALADVGYARVELHEAAQPLVGYQGDGDLSAIGNLPQSRPEISRR